MTNAKPEKNRSAHTLIEIDVRTRFPPENAKQHIESIVPNMWCTSSDEPATATRGIFILNIDYDYDYYQIILWLVLRWDRPPDWHWTCRSISEIRCVCVCR